jgi:hypothetical protein
LRNSKRSRDRAIIAIAEAHLQLAVDRARRRGIQWGEIGEILGIARGCAYQRYRRPL